MERWSGKIAVVTGASSGIGSAIVKVLVKNGLSVIGLARRKDLVLDLADQFKDQYSGNLYALECDLTKEEEVLAAFQWVKDKFGGLDVLVNNAGVLRFSTLTDGVTEDWRQTFDVNVMAVCICTREALKLMEGREFGHVINICSVAGHRIPNVIPSFLNVYPASKHALRAISDTLRIECTRNKRKIKVTNLSPGTVATEIAKGTGDLGEKLTEQDISELSRHTVFLQAEDIAEAVLTVLGTPQHVEIRELVIEALGAVL